MRPYVSTTKNKHPIWYNGEVLQRIERVLYKVLVGGTPPIRHARLLLMRTYDRTDTTQQDLDVLFEMASFSKHNQQRTGIIFGDQLAHDSQRDYGTWIHMKGSTLFYVIFFLKERGRM